MVGGGTADDSVDSVTGGGPALAVTAPVVAVVVGGSELEEPNKVKRATPHATAAATIPPTMASTFLLGPVRVWTVRAD